MKQTVALLFALASIVVHAQTDKIYSQADYSIKYPAKWTLDTSKKVAAATFFYSPLENSSDNFSENVNIMTQNLKGQNIDLAAYKSITEQQITAAADNAKLLTSKIEKTATGDRYFVEYHLTMNGNKLHIKSICYIKRDTAYLATFTTKLDTFDKYNQTGTAMLESFKVR